MCLVFIAIQCLAVRFFLPSRLANSGNRVPTVHNIKCAANRLMIHGRQCGSSLVSSNTCLVHVLCTTRALEQGRGERLSKPLSGAWPFAFFCNYWVAQYSRYYQSPTKHSILLAPTIYGFWAVIGGTAPVSHGIDQRDHLHAQPQQLPRSLIVPGDKLGRSAYYMLWLSSGQSWPWKTCYAAAGSHIVSPSDGLSNRLKAM